MLEVPVYNDLLVHSRIVKCRWQPSDDQNETHTCMIAATMLEHSAALDGLLDQLIPSEEFNCALTVRDRHRC